MANPNPKTEHLTPFQKVGKEALSKKPLQVRIPQSDYDTLMDIPSQKRLALIRQWIKSGLENLQQDSNIQVN